LNNFVRYFLEPIRIAFFLEHFVLRISQMCVNKLDTLLLMPLLNCFHYKKIKSKIKMSCRPRGL